MAVAAPARRRAGRAASLLAAAFVIYGVSSGGAFAGARQQPGPAASAAPTPLRLRSRGAPPRGATARGASGEESGGARPLSDFKLNEVVDGRVAFRTKGRGVFCDVGAEKCAILQARKALAMKLEINETLKGMRVTKIDPDTGFFDVTYDGLADYMKDRYTPTSEIAVGDILQGRVVLKSRGGVLLDVGLDSDAKLRARFAMQMKLRPNETLTGLRVVGINEGASKVWVECDELEEIIKDRWKPVSDFKVGDVVTGRMLAQFNKGEARIDVDSQLDAVLESSPELVLKLQKGDVLEGVRVIEANEEQRVLRVAFDGLEAFLKGKGRI